MQKKKSTVISAKAEKSAVISQKSHKHAELEKSIASLKKEINELKGQCQSCCKELDIAKSQIEEFKSSAQSVLKDPRVDELIAIIASSDNYKLMNLKVKKANKIK
jgi:septal ring factor EnvC (AmiA/AmiB activator)